jgi:hypothetical protein
MHRPLGQAHSIAIGSAQFRCNLVPPPIITGPSSVLLEYQMVHATVKELCVNEVYLPDSKSADGS